MKQLDFLNREQYLYDTSIALIREYEPVALARNPLGYIVGYSGGKDSDVLVWLFIRAGVKFAIMHNHTTLDSPQTVYHIRERFNYWSGLGIPCFVHKPSRNFFKICEDNSMLPRMNARFCCRELKEVDLPQYSGACMSFGVRRAESVKRKAQRDSIEMRDKADYSDKQKFHFDDMDNPALTSACYTKKYFIVNPIAYYPDNLIWDIIKAERLIVNPQYSMGFTRVGCIGCPMAGDGRLEQFKMFPKYKQMYLKCADRIISKRIEQGKENKHGFKNGQEYFNWWIENPTAQLNIEKGQISIFEE